MLTRRLGRLRVLLVAVIREADKRMMNVVSAGPCPNKQA